MVLGRLSAKRNLKPKRKWGMMLERRWECKICCTIHIVYAKQLHCFCWGPKLPTPKQQKNIKQTHTIHVWYIYLHLVTFGYIWLIIMVNVGIYDIHGCYGKQPRWRMNKPLSSDRGAMRWIKFSSAWGGRFRFFSAAADMGRWRNENDDIFLGNCLTQKSFGKMFIHSWRYHIFFKWGGSTTNEMGIFGRFLSWIHCT